MRKIISLTEEKLIKLIKNILSEAPSDFTFFSENESLQQLRDALDRNKMVSVAYIKKDGTVRHMLVRRYLSSYIPSESPKSDAQMNVQQNNDIKRVVDVNVYRKSLKELRTRGENDEVAKSESAKKSWRTINLKEVLGFLVGGNFVDLREENNILERYGQTIHDTLTKGMINSMMVDNENL